MSTIAWLFVLAGSLLVRQVAKGRTMETATDMKDGFLALVTGDWDGIAEVAKRTGTPALQDTGVLGGLGDSPAVDSAVGDATQSAQNAALLNETMRLGKAASGYTWGATGPNRYDCSGLVWRAFRNLGYKGPRFTTFTWPAVGRKFCEQVTTPAPGDIVVWQQGGTNGHMGVVTSGGNFYSARNPKRGINNAPMKGIPGAISYWRLRPGAFR